MQTVSGPMLSDLPVKVMRCPHRFPGCCRARRHGAPDCPAQPWRGAQSVQKEVHQSCTHTRAHTSHRQRVCMYALPSGLTGMTTTRPQVTDMLDLVTLAIFILTCAVYPASDICRAVRSCRRAACRGVFWHERSAFLRLWLARGQIRLMPLGFSVRAAKHVSGVRFRIEIRVAMRIRVSVFPLELGCAFRASVSG